MGYLGILFLFTGYTLLYAATARGGVFATEPWLGLFADAYQSGIAADVGAAVAGTGSGAP